MYLQKCFIRKYTDEIGEKLYEMTGGKTGAVLLYPDYDDALTAIDGNSDYWKIINRPSDCYTPDRSKNAIDCYLDLGYIDCGTNEQLFFAIAALRDDTDKYQWFRIVGANGIKWIKSVEENFTYDAAHNVWSKATVEELIEHFKDK